MNAQSQSCSHGENGYIQALAFGGIVRHLLIKDQDGNVVAVLTEDDVEELLVYYAGIPELEDWLYEKP